MKINTNTQSKTMQITNKRKAKEADKGKSNGAAKPSGNLVNWTKRFCVMHCREAFKRDT